MKIFQNKVFACNDEDIERVKKYLQNKSFDPKSIQNFYELEAYRYLDLKKSETKDDEV